MKKLAVIIVMATLLYGCNKLFPPKVGCSSEGTKRLVAQIFNDELAKHLMNPLFKGNVDKVKSSIDLSLEAIRTDSHDEKINKYECKAELLTKLPLKAKQILQDPAVKNVLRKNNVENTGEGIKTSITYSSQLTDSKDQQYVEMIGHFNLADAITGIALLGGFDTSTATTEDTATSNISGDTADSKNIVPSEVPTQSKEQDVSACVEGKTAAYRNEAGEDAIIKYDIIDEWESECKTAQSQ